ncbi:hypothetical protein X759_11540 [Mesorhizobium sp. LSHC420B00]|uniref:hypothetical protein n=1 Tax=unclassified Mesorhizobium TaxID=325217 RepID=UPI0003CF46B4|nr:hypothetical protein X759_11540 [Mesorhizobium sp. LSHC420B00]
MQFCRVAAAKSAERLRVWPHIYRLKRDLDRFVTALADAVAQVHRRELALQELTVADTCGQAIRRWAR